MWINIFKLCKLCISFWERVYCLFKVNVGFPPSLCPLRCPRLSPSSFLSSFFLSFFLLCRCLSDSLQHFNQALKIPVFSFIHGGRAVMQPVWAGGREVNPLSQRRQEPHRPPSDSSMPKSERTSLIHHAPPPSSSFTATNLHKNPPETILHDSLCHLPGRQLRFTWWSRGEKYRGNTVFSGL